MTNLINVCAQCGQTGQNANKIPRHTSKVNYVCMVLHSALLPSCTVSASLWCMFSPCGCCWGRLTPLLPTISGPGTRNLNQGSYTRYTTTAASADLSPAQTRRFLVVCRRTKNWFCIIISSTNTLKRKSPLLGPAVTRHLTVYRQQAALCQLEKAGERRTVVQH